MTTPKTKSGKTANDFHIPPKLLQQDRDLVNLILGSESMDDDERQYWFNLYSMMNAEQVGKLRDILTREREKLAEIDARYGKKRKPQLECGADSGAQREDAAGAGKKASRAGSTRARSAKKRTAQRQYFKRVGRFVGLGLAGGWILDRLPRRKK